MAADWLNKNLRFPNWSRHSADTVASLPVQSMRAWAERAGYSLNKSSSREDRDAGLSILTADVPVLSQDQLSILSAAEWERRKSDFVYSTWIARAEADANTTR